jgi:hypothetical protein
MCSVIITPRATQPTHLFWCVRLRVCFVVSSSHATKPTHHSSCVGLCSCFFITVHPLNPAHPRMVRRAALVLCHHQPLCDPAHPPFLVRRGAFVLCRRTSCNSAHSPHLVRYAACFHAHRNLPINLLVCSLKAARGLSPPPPRFGAWQFVTWLALRGQCM